MKKHNIKVSLQPVGNSEMLPIRLRVSWSGLRCDLSLGVSYNIDKWVKELGRAKQNTRNNLKQSASEINGLIEDAVRWVDTFFVKSELNGAQISAKELKAAFLADFRKQGSANIRADIMQVYDEFLIENSQIKGWADNTLKRYQTLKIILKNYGITFANFNEFFFRDYIQTETIKGLKNSTITRNIKILKSFAKYCFVKKIISVDLSKFNPRLKGSGGNQKAIIFCEFSEIETLINAKELPQNLAVVCDMFVFSCFSGLRFSDVKNLKQSDIKNGKIYVVTKKTSTALEIELNKYTSAIIQKYEENNEKFLFPQHLNSTINKNLKILFKKLNLNRPVKQIYFSGSERIEKNVPLYSAISFHAARRSFVVECLRRGIPAEVIMKWTGHSDYSAMKPYIEIVDSLKSNEMKKFDV